ncbi:a21bd30f-373f-4c30-8a59-2952ec52f518 [Thermothielavioides terrestris]|nr:a21bd30f-373f-4c30-8a59-2952ec52f518 [Thermothielavioides terrestris]
MISLWL